jgi:hypothetical protein
MHLCQLLCDAAFISKFFLYTFPSSAIWMQQELDRLEVLTAVLLKNQLFWDVML